MLTFILDLIIKDRLINCNANIILKKTELLIRTTGLEDDKKADYCIYQWLIKKLIYFIYNIRSNIKFVVKQFNKQKPNLKKRHL